MTRSNPLIRELLDEQFRHVGAAPPSPPPPLTTLDVERHRAELLDELRATTPTMRRPDEESRRCRR